MNNHINFNNVRYEIQNLIKNWLRLFANSTAEFANSINPEVRILNYLARNQHVRQAHQNPPEDVPINDLTEPEKAEIERKVDELFNCNVVPGQFIENPDGKLVLHVVDGPDGINTRNIDDLFEQTEQTLPQMQQMNTMSLREQLLTNLIYISGLSHPIQLTEDESSDLEANLDPRDVRSHRLSDLALLPDTTHLPSNSSDQGTPTNNGQEHANTSSPRRRPPQ